jgi:Lysozyme like domain
VKLSTHEAAWLAAQVGFTTNPCAGLPAGVVATEIETYVAVCCAESGLDSEAIGKTSTDGNWDHGLSQESGKWQWDKIQAEGGRWRDPLVNTRIAYKVFVAGGKDAAGTTVPRSFYPWSTFLSGAYQKWLPAAKLGAAHPWPYVDQFQSLIAERDQARSQLSAAQAALATERQTTAALNARVAQLTTGNTNLQAALDAATARLNAIRTDLG